MSYRDDGIDHELRASLLEIVALSEQQLAEPLSPQARACAERVLRLARRLLAGIDDAHKHAATEAGTLATGQASSLPAIDENQRSVLIVDDQPVNVKALANGLKDDYRVLVASKGEKALEIARGPHPPDLILLDIVMPGMDGYAVCRELRNDPRTSHIPIMFVSALDEVEDEEKGLNLGAVDYVSKPFHLPTVRARVRNHINLKIRTDLLEQMSSRDGLTRVANRRHFDEVLGREVARHARGQRPLGLVMLDIDFFKPYNDHYGHGLGDECLIRVAAALAGSLNRPGDLFARYGGEEFVALLADTDAQGVESIAENMRRAVEALALRHEYSSVAEHVTVSLGGASRVPARSGDGAVLLRQADEALYRAKHAGRNRVEMATDEPDRNAVDGVTAV